MTNDETSSETYQKDQTSRYSIKRKKLEKETTNDFFVLGLKTSKKNFVLEIWAISIDFGGHKSFFCIGKKIEKKILRNCSEKNLLVLLL